MAYYTGSAANVAAVLTALTDACVAEGWTWSGGILYKADPGIFVRLDAATTLGGQTPLCLWGRTYIDSGETPQFVSLNVPVQGTAPTYPVTYHIFVFSDEVFLVINYSEKFQWLAFGQSDQPGLGSSGNWVAATCGHNNGGSDGWSTVWGCSLNLNGGNLGYGYNVGQQTIVPAMFWADLQDMEVDYRACNTAANWYLDAGLEAGTYRPWMQPKDAASQKYVCELLATQPNAFNNEGVLIPIKVFQKRSSSKFSQVLQVQNARHIRLDNYTPTEIIALGTDRWMVFPWYLKNTASRSSIASYTSPTHSGTFGWAIKYEPAT